MRRRLRSAGLPFTFSDENREKVKAAMGQYPEGRQASAVKSILDLAQRQMGGWVSQEAVEEVARLLEMSPMAVYEIVTFYTMFNLAPLGQVHVEVCTTTPCWLRGADDLLAQCQRRASESKEGQLTVTEVECLGACVNAPVIKIGDDYFEDLNAPVVEKILGDALKGKALKPGSYTGRLHSAPFGFCTTEGDTS